MTPAFLRRKKICSRNSGEIFSRSEMVLMETGDPFSLVLAKARTARNAYLPFVVMRNFVLPV